MGKILNRALQNASEIISAQKLNRGFRGAWNAAAAAIFGLIDAPTGSVFIGNGCKAVITSPGSLGVDLSAGLALHDIASGDIFTADHRPILLDVKQNVQLTPNASGSDRIDRVSIRAVEVDEDPQVVDIKDPITGSISAQTRNQRTHYAYQVVATEGTPAGSPVAPATPAGYLAVCDILVQNAAGAITSGNITDLRTLDTRTAGELAAALVNTSAIKTLSGAAPLLVQDSAGAQTPVISRNSVKAFGYYTYSGVDNEFNLTSGYNMPAQSVRFVAGIFDFTFVDPTIIGSNAAIAIIQKNHNSYNASVADVVSGSLSGAHPAVALRLYYYDVSAGALEDPDTAGAGGAEYYIVILDASA